MKKVWSTVGIILLVGILFFIGLDNTKREGAEALVGSLPDSAVIVIGENATEAEITAATTLQKYIAEVAGFTPTVLRDNETIDGYVLSVGKTVFSEREVSSLADGSYRIGEIDEGLEIVGAGNRGLIYGVYAFLEEYGGYHVFTAEQGMTTKQRSIILPINGVEKSYDTYFEYTDTDWKSPTDVEYSVANGLSGNVYRSIPDSLGGDVGYIGPFCHTLATTYCARSTYFAGHPEYYALHDGKRTDKQLCLTNKDVVRIVTQEVLDLLASAHNPSESLQIISLTQDDNQDYCECENCKKIDEENHSHAGTMITFINQIADSVKTAGYDNVAIDTFAYQYTRTTPTKVQPNENVIVRLCTIECCFSHPLDEKGCPENEKFMDDLTKWSEICNRLYVWDYTTNYAYTVGLFPDFGVLQKNMQIFYEHNVKGVYEEGNYYIGYCDGEFGELRAYLIARLLQNPYCDYGKAMNDFLYFYYGNGGGYIGDFIDKMTENAKKQHVTIYTSMKKSLTFTEKEVKTCDELWEKAKIGASEEELSHILRSEISWRYWKASCNKGEFGGIHKIEERKQLLADMKAFGITMLNEGGSFTYSEKLEYFSPTYWKNGLQRSDFAVNVTNWVVLGVSFVVACVIMVFGIKKKQYYSLSYPAGILAFAGLSIWLRSTFCAWSNIPLYVFINLFIGVTFACLFTLCFAQKNKKSLILWSGIGLAWYAVVGVGLLSIIHSVVYNYIHSDFSFDVTFLSESISLLFILSHKMVGTLRKKK